MFEPPAVTPAENRRLDFWLPAVLAGIFVLLLLPKIGAGTLWHHDELLTANRAREMIVRGDVFEVTVNFEPSVKKPPLQYWACAALLRLLPGHPELALRLPTLLAGAGCLLAAAWLARVCSPEGNGRAQTALWSVGLLAGCGYLIHFSRVALLDTAAALFLTLALVGCRLARRDARWWWFVAAVSVLGAWQKAPYGLAAWTVVLLVRRFSGGKPSGTDSHPPRWRGHLPAALALAVLGSFAWWIIQWIHLDHAVLLRASREQVGGFLRAHDPSDEGFRPWLYWAWMARDWTLPGILAPLAVVAAVWPARRQPPGNSQAELGWVCLVFGAVIAGLPYRAERYLVVFTPVLAVLVVDLLRRAARRLPTPAAAWVLPLAFATTLPGAAFQYGKAAPAQPDLFIIARELGHSVPADDKVFVCTDADSGFDVAGFLLFYADLHHPVATVTWQDVWQAPAGWGHRSGVCSQSQWENLQRGLTTLRKVAQNGNWVLWTENNPPVRQRN